MRYLLVLAAVAWLALIACDDNQDIGGVCDPCPPPTRAYLDRSEKWHVLNNIELSYNKHSLDRYDALLDENFIFYLSVGDVGGGLPESWGRETEYTVHSHLFGAAPTTGPKIRDLKLDLDWETDPASLNPQPKDLNWIALPNSGPNADETWYQTTVFYNYEIEVEPDLTYLNGPGAKVVFTVRNAGTDEAPKWTMVEMRDLGNDALFASVSATEQSTWGRVKSLYRD